MPFGCGVGGVILKTLSQQVVRVRVNPTEVSDVVEEDVCHVDGVAWFVVSQRSYLGGHFGSTGRRRVDEGQAKLDCAFLLYYKYCSWVALVIPIA